MVSIPQEKSYYNIAVMSLIIIIFLILAMAIVVLYQVMHKPLPQFNAIAQNGQTLQLASFDEPNYLPNTLLTWASKAAVAFYTFDFVNYNKQMNFARQYFTDAGWIDYQNSVGRLIADITAKQLFVNSVVSGPPVISHQGDFPGRGYLWQVQLPFLVTFQSSEQTSRENYIVLMTIVKISTNINPVGIGVDRFVMRQA